MNNPYTETCTACGHGLQTATASQSPGFSQPAAAANQAVSPGYYYTGTYVAPNPATPSIQVPGTLTQPPAGSTLPITPLTQPAPVTTESIQFLNGYLRTQIGRKVTVDFLIGTNTLVDRTGTLLGVGANYILINELETDDITVCDFFTIKFVRVYG